jgi:hypothetical protein
MIRAPIKGTRKGAVHGSLTVRRFAQVLQAIFGRRTPGLEIRFLLLGIGGARP